MTFTRPTIGPKVYLSRGPSGHAETFERTHADNELKIYLHTTSTLHIAIGGFIRKMRAERRPEQWADVIDYLGQLTGLGADHVPIGVGVAFWAHVSVERDALRAAKLTAQGN